MATKNNIRSIARPLSGIKGERSESKKIFPGPYQTWEKKNKEKFFAALDAGLLPCLFPQPRG